MPRFARIVVPGVPHHITQRGNNQQDVFFVDDDYRVYLRILAEEAKKFELDILGYCLMTNHIHLIATPKNEDSLAKAAGRAHFRYTQYINRMHSRSGHLWQNRFYSCPLDRKHFWLALRYIETNPVRAKLLRLPWMYPWSSAAVHVGKSKEDGLVSITNWKRISTGVDWQYALRQGCSEVEMKIIRLGTNVGRPLATDNFLSKLEKTVGRRLRPLPVGRPKLESE